MKKYTALLLLLGICSFSYGQKKVDKKEETTTKVMKVEDTTDKILVEREKVVKKEAATLDGNQKTNQKTSEEKVIKKKRETVIGKERELKKRDSLKKAKSRAMDGNQRGVPEKEKDNGSIK